MPILIVNSHHSSPTDLTNLPSTWDGGISLKRPQPILYHGREPQRFIQGTLLASSEAVSKILTPSGDDFRGYDYRVDYVGFNTRNRKYEELSPEEQKKSLDCYEVDTKNPARRYLDTEAYSTGSSGISLVGTDDLYAKTMMALIEIIGTLPVIPVLQGYLFNPRNFDSLSIRNKEGLDLSQEYLSVKYPYGMLAYPKRIWPEFYSAVNGKSFLRISHHPHRNNDPHYHAFKNDPRLGELEENSSYEDIIQALKTRLLPLIEQAIEEERKAFNEQYPGVK